MRTFVGENRGHLISSKSLCKLPQLLHTVQGDSPAPLSFGVSLSHVLLIGGSKILQGWIEERI